jgi:hypothetical protein
MTKVKVDTEGLRDEEKRQTTPSRQVGTPLLTQEGKCKISKRSISLSSLVRRSTPAKREGGGMSDFTV